MHMHYRSETNQSENYHQTKSIAKVENINFIISLQFIKGLLHKHRSFHHGTNIHNK